MKLSKTQRGVLVAIVLGDMGTANKEWPDQRPSKKQMARGDKLADWLALVSDEGEPSPKEFFDAALALGEAAVNDKLEMQE